MSGMKEEKAKEIFGIFFLLVGGLYRCYLLSQTLGTRDATPKRDVFLFELCPLMMSMTVPHGRERVSFAWVEFTRRLFQ